MARKSPEQYVRRVGRELRLLELRIAQSIRGELIAAFAAIRELLLRELPDDGIARPLIYGALRQRIEDALVPLNDTLGNTIALEVWALQRRARLLASEWLGDPNRPDRPIADLMHRIRWLRHRMDDYFVRRSPSTFMKEILRLVDRTVQRGLMQGTPTAQIVEEILPEMVRGSRRSLLIRRGTVINAVRARVDSQIAAAIWQTFTAEAQDVWKDATERTEVLWEWSAVLDPRTCPICAPLDGQRRPTAAAFPVQPPVHPNCRCAILPITVAR